MFKPLIIPLSHSQNDSLLNAIYRFKKHEPNWLDYPQINKRKLHIWPLSLPFLIGYLPMNETNQFDLSRLLFPVRREMNKRLEQSEDYRTWNAYRMVIANLESIKPGEFVV